AREEAATGGEVTRPRARQDALRCGADPRPDLPFSFFRSGPSSERFGFFTSPRPARRFAMFWNSSVVRWLLETSAIIWPLLAAVENSFESNGITAIGWLSMVLANDLTSISARLCMPTWLMQYSGGRSFGRAAFSTVSMFLVLRRFARSGSATITMSSALTSARRV